MLEAGEPFLVTQRLAPSLAGRTPACFHIGIQTEAHALTHTLQGSLFKTLVVNEFLKKVAEICLSGRSLF
jgi:hypothetical protein